MRNSNQSETIDPRILRLIGLEDIFDLDYETYLTLLKEAMVKSRMSKTTIPTDEIMLVTDEYKRVKTKKDQGRFQVKKKKISSNLFNISDVKGLLIGNKNYKGLLPSQAIAKLPLKETLDDNISAITSAVISINETLKNQQKAKIDASAYGKRREEQEKRSLKESKLEKVFDGLKKTAEKIIAPVKSLLDKIFDFIGTVILGRIVYKLVEWLGDPENASKVKSIIRFVKDWWPALLGSYILFGSSFGKLIRGTIGLVSRFILQIGKVAIPQLLKFIKSPVGIGAALFTAGATVPALFPGTVNEQERKTSKEPGSNTDKIKSLQQQKANLNFFDKLYGKGAEIDEQISYLQTGKTKTYGFNGGGFANGYVSGEKGVDKVPAMLSDGEFVMSRGAVEKYGVDTLEAMNAAGGGTNKPKVMGGKIYADGGGSIGSKFSTDSEYYTQEILKGLSTQFKWANDLARRAGISVQNVMAQSANSLQGAITETAKSAYSGFMNKEADLHGYMTRGGMQNDAMKFGNQALSSLQDNFNTVRNVSKNAINSVDKIGTGEKYQKMSKNNEKKSQEAISKYDAWIQSLPKGFLKDTMNKGLIPIPTGNELGMTAATYIKAMLGPLGRPLRILSNDKVDKARQEMINRTAAANGLRVGPDGKMSMEWNRVGSKGSGQYTDEFAALGGSKSAGKFFNSTFGRWSGRQQGDRIVTDDVYNFNESVGSYAKKSKDALMKGNVGEGLYNIASMAGRFAQDIGWMNQRALGSEIDVGSVKNIDPKTGKPKKPTTPPSSVKMYGANDPRRKQTGPYKSRFARPKNAGVKPVKPPIQSKPKVVYGPPVPVSQKKNVRGGKTRSNKPPQFSASTKGSNAKAQTIGISR